MICSKCHDEGKKSVVNVGQGYMTAMYYAPFYDEEGTYHHHDYNAITERHSCSNGHQWEASRYNKCPGCSWPNKE